MASADEAAVAANDEEGAALLAGLGGDEAIGLEPEELAELMQLLRSARDDDAGRRGARGRWRDRDRRRRAVEVEIGQQLCDDAAERARLVHEPIRPQDGPPRPW